MLARGVVLAVIIAGFSALFFREPAVRQFRRAAPAAATDR
jgi:hypothetical protein